MNPFYLIMTPVGGLAGFLVGVATRPTVMGMPIPLSVLTSDAYFDQSYRDSLSVHLTVTTLIGAMLGLAVTAIIYHVKTSRTAGEGSNPQAARRDGINDTRPD